MSILVWRPISEATKDAEILVKGGEYEFSAETFPEWRLATGVALVQWDSLEEMWIGEKSGCGAFYYRPTHFITIEDLLK